MKYRKKPKYSRMENVINLKLDDGKINFNT